MAIVLQDADVTVSELHGRTCSAFRAVGCPGDTIFGLFYLRVEDTWHRFFLDAGLLFWHEGPAPDPEDDLGEGDRYVDLGTELGATGARIAVVEMRDGHFRIEFANGARLRMRNEVLEEPEIVERTPAPSR
jgi:hypothetical protein